MDQALTNASQLLDELSGLPKPVSHAPSMTQIGKIGYSHDAMVDLIISNPGISQNEIAAKFGYTPGWICHILASDAFQARLADRRDALVDPALRATIKQHFEALCRRSLEILQEKLSRPASSIPDNLALRAAELGARSIGLGRGEQQPQAPAGDRLTILADRLVVLQGNFRKELPNAQVKLPSPEGGEEGARSGEYLPSEATQRGTES